MFVTPESGLSFQWRPNAGGSSSYNGTLPGAAAYWVRLVRSGTNLTGYISSNGTNWTPAGNIGLGGLGPMAYWGLAVTAHNDSTGSVAVIDNVGLNTPVAISSVPDQAAVQSLATPAIPFTVGSATVPAESLIVTANSTNTTLLPAEGIVISGGGSNHLVTLAPTAGQKGASQVTLTVSDGVYTASTAFMFTVNPPPLISISPNVAAGQVELSWPLYAGGMRVWSASNLSPPVVWSLTTEADFTTNGGAIVATLPTTNRTRFFRLSSEAP